MEKVRQKQLEDKKAKLAKTIQILNSERQKSKPLRPPFINRDERYKNFLELIWTARNANHFKIIMWDLTNLSYKQFIQILVDFSPKLIITFMYFKSHIKLLQDYTTNLAWFCQCDVSSKMFSSFGLRMPTSPSSLPGRRAQFFASGLPFGPVTSTSSAQAAFARRTPTSQSLQQTGDSKKRNLFMFPYYTATNGRNANFRF